MTKRLQNERSDTPGQAPPAGGDSGALWANTADGRLWVFNLAGVPQEISSGGGGGGDPHYTSGGILDTAPVATADGSLAMGDGAIAVPADSIAIGTGADAQGVDSVAIGRNSVEVNPDSISFSALTGAMLMPRGTTGQRPNAPVSGHTRYNTSLNLLEFWNDTAWGPLESGAGGDPNQNAFSIVDPGDGNPASAAVPTDTLNLVGGVNITLTGDGIDTITIDAVATGEANQDAFSHVLIDGAPGGVDADVPEATMDLVGGTNITLTPTGASNRITITADPYPPPGDPHYVSGGTLTTPPGAAGENDLAMGEDAQAAGGDAIAIGTGSDAGVAEAVAIGHLAQALGVAGVAIGQGAEAQQTDGVAIGKATVTEGNNALALGDSARAATNGVALGVGANALGSQSVAVGNNAIADATDAMQFGAGTEDQISSVQYGLTGAMTLPGGLEAEIPATPRQGMLRFNSESPAGQELEYYDGTTWYVLTMVLKAGVPAVPAAPTDLAITPVP
jgi:hypothetical protein